MKTKTLTLMLLAVTLPVLAATDNHAGQHQMPNGMWMDNAAMKTTSATITAKAVPGGKQVVANVNGLVCDYCAQTIHQSLMKEPGVTDASVDLTAKTVTVSLKEGASLPEPRLKTLLKDAGYDLTGYKAE
jgi:copper chaperone CopZ